MNWQNAKKKDKYIIIPIYILVYYVSYLTRIQCVWKKLIGISCPGCGFTRSVLCMLRLDFRQAWTYHPMYWSVFLIAALFIFEGDLFRNKKINIITIILLLAGFLCVWIYRLYMGIVI